MTKLSPFQLFMRQALAFPLPNIYGLAPLEILAADDFRTGGFKTQIWDTTSSTDWTATETSGILRIAKPTTGGGGKNVYMKGGAADLTGCGISSKVVDAGAQDGEGCVVIPCSFDQADDNNGIYVSIISNVIAFADWSTEFFTMAYDPLIHKYFRIREKNGTTFFEISENGIQYETFFSMDNPADWTQANIAGCGFFHWASHAANHADFDNLLVARYE